MITPTDFRTTIITPAFQAFTPYPSVALTPFVANLLMSTCAVESEMGTYTKQIDGPALGIFQMDPSTLTDTVAIARSLFPVTYQAVENPSMVPAAQILVDNVYAAVLCRIYYYSRPFVMPTTDDVNNLWLIYKKWWNTRAGSTTKAQFVSALALTDIPH
jgi:hypothetical protein